MAKTRNIVTEWGQAANTSNSGYGAGANNTIGWGSVHANSSGHDRTDLVGVPSVYVGNSETVDGSGDPTGGTAQLFYRNRIEARPLWDTRQNLLTYSEDFSNADWVKGDLTVSGNEITPDAGSVTPNLQVSGAYPKTSTLSVIAEANGYDFLRLVLHDASNTAYWSAATFDLTNGDTNVFDYQQFSEGVAQATDLGNGRYLCTLTSTCALDIDRVFIQPATTLTILTSDGRGRETFTADGTSGILLYQAWLNEGSTADEYVKTEATPYSFKGDETQLNDYSASNNGGQIYSGGGLSFTTNDYTESVDVGNVRTIAMWINLDGASETIIDLDGGTHISTASGDLNVAGSVGSTNYVDGVASDTVGSGSYKMICVVLDSAVDADAVRLARQGGNYGDLDIAEVRLFEDALTASEALIIYNNPQERGVNGKTPKVDWDINELNGGTLFDRSGNGYNATINGATWVSGVKEGYQPALAGFNNYQTFDGSDDYVDFSTIPDWASTTVRFGFVYTAGEQQIFEIGDAGNTRAIAATINRGNGNTPDFVVASDNSGFATNGASWGLQGLTLGKYYEVSILVDATYQITSGTINGTPLNVSTSTTRAGGATQFRLGIRNSGNFPYSGVLTHFTIDGVFSASNLGGWVDEIGSNDGTVNGSPSSARIAGAEFNSTTDVFSNTIQNAYIANALNFSGGYNTLRVDAGGVIPPHVNGVVSLAVWMRFVSTSSSQVIYDDRDSNNGVLFFIDHNAGSPLLCYSSSNGGVVTTVKTGSYTYETWSFICITKDASNNVYFYIGDKNTAPTQTGTTQSGTTAGTGGNNGTFFQQPRNLTQLTSNLYAIYPLMYTEDLSTANTDLAPIEQIWDATKSLIPS